MVFDVKTNLAGFYDGSLILQKREYVIKIYKIYTNNIFYS